MPREASITYEQVAAIADGIKAAGGKPTPRQIRERHGSGSLGTIHKLFQRWEGNQPPSIEAGSALPPALQRAILEFVTQERATARADLDAKLSDVQAAANELAAENVRQSGHIETLESTLQMSQEEKAALAGKIEQMEADLSTARDEAARERQAAEATRTELAKAHVRLDTIPILEKDNERLRSAVDAERDARTNAERLAAIAEAKAAGLAERLADSQARHTHEVAKLDSQLQDQKQRNANLEADLSETRKESRDLAARLAQATGELEALRAQNAGHLDVIKGFTAQGAMTGES
ncbi:DNA-binding protein [Aromatoleum anaerobium]|uniref:Mucin-associated surface protein n=1 Tax=Aromatoleum anaerobium TaxID=182180 RepID=A0ABX1PS83_9RHOO|nr:DNA-binding protein [Aromatoleum anaerobium]MCK0505706.1 DNA-binding protein [Aromatoleum anaerobium]